MKQTKIKLDGRVYKTTVIQNVVSKPDVPRIIIPAFLPNDTASEILRVCIRSIQQHTNNPFELWVTDNFSPDDNGAWLRDEPDINVVFNHTAPIPPMARKWWHQIKPPVDRLHEWGSYNNAIGLEIARALVPSTTKWLVTAHMDTLVTEGHWLQFLLNQCNDQVRAAGVRMDTARTTEGVLHVLGYLVDYQLFLSLNLDFFPQLPVYDVGDLITVKIREAGYDVSACRNSLWEPDILRLLPETSIYHNLHVDRALDDDDRVIFLHLGRGVRKSNGTVVKGTSPEEWVAFAYEHLLN